MTTHDISPLFRTAIGFDRLVRLLNAAEDNSATSSYPPYNIEKLGEDTYRISMAVAGFRPRELEITAADGTLTVVGKVDKLDESSRYLYRGISGRAFERKFALADHVVAEGSRLEYGLLHIELRRIVPESLKPRRITISLDSSPSLEVDNSPKDTNT